MPIEVWFFGFLGLAGVVLLGFLWQVALRPFALSLGVIKPNAHDFLIRGWSAERSGRRADALAAYDQALRLRRWYTEAKERRENLLQSHPELADTRGVDPKSREQEKPA